MGRPLRRQFRRIVRQTGQTRVRGEQPVKKGCFSNDERLLLREYLTLYRGSELRMIPKSVFEMEKWELSNALPDLMRALPRSEKNKVPALNKIIEKMQKRFDKILDDEEARRRKIGQ